MNKMLNTKDITLLVKTTHLEESCNTKLAEIKKSILASLENINEDDKCSIIELRNKPMICELADTDNFINENLQFIHDIVFSKSIALSEAVNILFNVNTVLNKNYELCDLYNNMKLSENAENIEYDNVNITVLNDYRNRLEQKATYCNECLFGDLYNTTVLSEDLPILCYITNK